MMISLDSATMKILDFMLDGDDLYETLSILVTSVFYKDQGMVYQTCIVGFDKDVLNEKDMGNDMRYKIENGFDMNDACHQKCKGKKLS